MIRRLYEILEPPREGDSASRNFDLVVLALILLSDCGMAMRRAFSPYPFLGTRDQGFHPWLG